MLVLKALLVPTAITSKVVLRLSCLTVLIKKLEFAGKFGGSVAVAEKVSVYGELSGMTGDELSIGTKLGMKYSF